MTTDYFWFLKRSFHFCLLIAFFYTISAILGPQRIRTKNYLPSLIHTDNKIKQENKLVNVLTCGYCNYDYKVK